MPADAERDLVAGIIQLANLLTRSLAPVFEKARVTPQQWAILATLEHAGQPMSLAALARTHPGTVPAGAMDEARELATYGDQFAALADPAPDDLALIADGTHTPYRSVVPQRDWPASSRVSVSGDLAQVLESTLAAWALDGSVVLARNGQRAGGEPQPARLASENVTLDLA
jgi:hypothetical protein